MEENSGVAIKQGAEPFAVKLGSVGFAVATFIVIVAVSWFVWILFVDPKIGLSSFYPQPFGAYLFWGILVVVFLGFNLGMFGFSKMKQPLCGIVTTIVGVIISFAITLLLVFWWGGMDPAFKAPAGYGAAGLLVLIGFYGWGMPATGMGGWPWENVEQPLAGVAQLCLGFSLTIIGYIIVIYPALASWTSPARVIFSLPTAIGWFYCAIVAWLATFLLFDNWPFSAFGSKAATALGALFLNIVLGTILYFIFLAVLKGVLIPTAALAKIGGGINLWPAQLGVWIVFWMLFWPNLAGNAPTGLGKAGNFIIRFIITWGLGVICFLIDMHWFEMKVLHLAPIVPGFGGDPLTWVDILNYILLVYVVYWACWPFAKKEA